MFFVYCPVTVYVYNDTQRYLCVTILKISFILKNNGLVDYNNIIDTTTIDTTTIDKCRLCIHVQLSVGALSLAGVCLEALLSVLQDWSRFCYIYKGLVYLVHLLYLQLQCSPQAER